MNLTFIEVCIYSHCQYPFSFFEYCGITGVDTNSYSTKARALRKTALEKYMEDGGFPELISETNRAGYVSGLVNAIINTDTPSGSN